MLVNNIMVSEPNILQNLTKMDNNETPINIYLDLSTAFYTIDDNILKSKLEYYGIKIGANIYIGT